MLKKVGRIVFFVGICFLALVFLLLLFPGLKEGFSWSEVPYLLAGIGILLAVGVLWWLAQGRSLRRSALGLLVLLVPTGIYSLVAGQHLWAHYQGARLADATHITSYQESFIEWPGFDGPVGLTIELTLEYPVGAKGLVYPPELRVGRALEISRNSLSATVTSGAGYFKDHHIDATVGPLTLLKNVLFQSYFPDRFADKRLDPSGTTRFVFHLYPGTVA